MNKKHSNTTSLIRDVKRRTRRKFSAEEKIRIVIEGLRGEESIAEICRKESIHPNQYYKWSKDFMEAAKKRMMGDTQREANTDEVKALRDENDELKKLVAELSLKNKVLKKSLSGLE
jgi:transposase